MLWVWEGVAVIEMMQTEAFRGSLTILKGFGGLAQDMSR